MNPCRRLVEETALAIRAHAAWRAAPQVPLGDRELLLSYVVWPTTTVAALSEERASEELLAFRSAGGRQWPLAS